MGIFFSKLALNELSEEYNVPLEFPSGSTEFVSIFIPWTSLLSENTVIEVKGLNLVFQPKERPQDASMFDSMRGSMASSLQLAEECLNEDIDVPDRSEGLQKIAKTIDAFLSNLKIVFHDTSIKIEHHILHKSTGSSLEIKIKMAEYFDEEGVNSQTSSCSKENEKTSYESSTFSVKRDVFEGASLFTSEFLSEERSFSAFQQTFPSSNLDPKLFVPGSPEIPPTYSSLPVRKSELNFQWEPILISRLSGQQELRLKLKQNEAVSGLKTNSERALHGAFV